MLATGSLVPNISIYIYIQGTGKTRVSIVCIYPCIYTHHKYLHICYMLRRIRVLSQRYFRFFFDSLAILVLYLSRIMFQLKMDPRLVSEMHSFTSLVTFLCSLTMGESGYGGYTYPVVEGSFHEPF